MSYSECNADSGPLYDARAYGAESPIGQRKLLQPLEAESPVFFKLQIRPVKLILCAFNPWLNHSGTYGAQRL